MFEKAIAFTFHHKFAALICYQSVIRKTQKNDNKKHPAERSLLSNVICLHFIRVK